MSSSTLVSVHQYVGQLYACFTNQPCALYIAFDKCFYNCDVVVETQARNQLMTPGGRRVF